MNTPSLSCSGLDIRVADRTLVRNLELRLAGGRLVCLLGTNGAGKTLTLHTLAGLREHEGNIRVGDTPLAGLPRKELARRLGLLLQIQEDAFPLTVRESVLMGAYARLRAWEPADEAAHEAARNALVELDLVGLDERELTSLSGGERERVALATLYVQNPDVWLLDEPMNHLDPLHQLTVMRLLRRQADAGRVVLASLHNPTMALRYADDALLLFGDGTWIFGPASDLVEPTNLERMYGTPFRYYNHADERVLLPA